MPTTESKSESDKYAQVGEYIFFLRLLHFHKIVPAYSVPK